MDKANKLFEEALVHAKATHEAKKARDAAREAKAAAANGGEVKKEDAPKKEDEGEEDKLPVSSAPSSVLIMHGNILYDWSQVRTAS
jgi:hypothetical protein